LKFRFGNLLAVAFAAAALCAGAVVHAERQLVDRVVAMVDGEPVLLSEVVQEMNLLRLQRNLGDLTAAEQKQLYDDVLDGMINDQLLVVDAKAKGIEVSDEELRQAVDDAVRSIKERLGGEERYRAELQKQGLTEAEVRDLHREQKRKQILAGRIVQSEIRRQVEVSDADVRTAWDTERDSIPADVLAIPEKIQLRHLLIVPQADAKSVQRAQEVIARAAARVRAGDDFATVAREMSEWPTAQSGGFLGSFRYGDFESAAFDEAVEKLNPGDVSDVISTRYGLQIVKLESRDGDMMTARHIVAKLETTTDDQVRALEKATDLRARIEKGESFEDLARSFSDDPATRDAGGLVSDELATGELLPEFRAALDSTAVGGVTQVIRSAQGFHLFKVVSRTPGREASFEEVQPTIRRWLEQRQLESRYNDYIAGLRKKFSIDIKA